ncbi:SDR family oxidoreductase [Nonomuraea fuscirosea]|nr:SDR family oxidoreductase [Nonomuraea fuscirosea]WSA50033.1 SDR family oxidoreductase [Nonomuraea fuscirosea]
MLPAHLLARAATPEAVADVITSLVRDVRADVADPGELRGLFQVPEERFGGLDVFVGNAATVRYAAVADISDEHFDLMWRTNTRATLIGIRESARRIRDGGRIVIVSSGAVVAAPPGVGPYAASKAAGDVLVQTAARELGPRGITVNSVLPGPTRTEMLNVDPGLIAAQTPRWAGSANPRTSPTSSASSPRRPAAGSPGRRSARRADSSDNSFSRRANGT